MSISKEREIGEEDKVGGAIVIVGIHSKSLLLMCWFVLDICCTQTCDDGPTGPYRGPQQQS
jgi:hypothetical protein